jgi:hypothetical protein
MMRQWRLYLNYGDIQSFKLRNRYYSKIVQKKAGEEMRRLREN